MQQKDVGNFSPSHSDQTYTNTQAADISKEDKEVDYLRSKLRKSSIRYQQTMKELDR